MKEDKKQLGIWGLYKMGGITPAVTSVFNAQSAQQMAFIRSVMKDQRKHSLLETPLSELDAVSFDLETTGFSPYNGDEIISFGAVVVNNNTVKEEETFYSLVNPKCKIPQHIEELTGIRNEMAESAPELILALRGFMEFVHHRVLIAHGSGHDKHFLNAALWRTSKVNLSHRLLDTMMIAKWLYPKRGSYTLDEMLDYYGIPITQRHHALEDSIMTAKLWLKLKEEASERSVNTLGDLYAYLSRH